MAIIWMEHPKHGKNPCTESDVEMFVKAGWKPVVAPAEKPSALEKEALKPKEPFAAPKANAKVATGKDLTREEMIQLAESMGIEVDHRWGAEKLKEILGLD